MRKLSFQDKDFINYFYRKSGAELGYNSFTGTLSVAHGHNNEVYLESLEDSLFYIEVNPEDNSKNLIPIFLGSQLKSRIGKVKEYVHDEKIDSVSYIDHSFVGDLSTVLSLKPDSDSEHEAICPIERFRDFKGIDSHNSPKRQANIFFRDNDYSFSLYNPKNDGSIVKLIENWEKESPHPTDGCDLRITNFFIKDFDNLGIIGFNLLIDGEVAAYTFGEKINHKTFISYTMKANRKYQGAYQAFWNLICSHPILGDIDFINNTNLTDIPSLRESKLRLKPEKM